MTRRGFTLLEVVLAIALLASLVVAAVELTITSTKAARAREAPIAAEAATRAVWRILDDAVMAFDTIPDNRPPRIVATGESVTLRTRAFPGGALLRKFEFDRPRRRLMLQDQPILPERDATSPRVLVDRVREFRATFEERSRVLRVALEREDGATEERRWVLP